MSVQQILGILCPECGVETEAVIQDIVNGQDLIARSAFLTERLNEVECVQCQTNITPTVPILYYDMEKELAFVLTPPESSPGTSTPQEMISVLINTLINTLPVAQRKSYLFTPKRFDSFEKMGKAILELDGLSEETRQQQIEKAQLIETLLFAPDEATFQQTIKAHDADLDYEFFELFTGYIHAAQMEGDDTRARTLFALREHLAGLSTHGKEAIAQIDAQLSAAVVKRQEQLLEQLQSARNNEQRERLIADNYAALDLDFFQRLTTKINEATQAKDSDTANSLKALRDNIVFLRDKYEKKAKAALEKGESLFKEIIQSDEPDQVIKENLADINESFFLVLGANIERARQQGHEGPAEALEKIGQVAVAMLQEQRPSKS